MHLAGLVSMANLPLPLAIDMQRKQVAMLKKHALQFGVLNAQCHLTLSEELAGIVAPPPKSPQQRIPMLQMHITVARGQQQYLWRNFAGALETYEQAAVAIRACPAMPANISFRFYRSLTLLASAISVDGAWQGVSKLLVGHNGHPTCELPKNYDAARFMRQLTAADDYLAVIATWCEAAPSNWQHKVALIRAERNRVCIFSHLATHHLLFQTMQLYDEAIELAQLYDFPLEQALACELASRFYDACGRTQQARSLLHQAYALYVRFGAKGKLQLLREEFPAYAFDALDIASPEVGATAISRGSLSSSASSSAGGLRARGVSDPSISGDSSSFSTPSNATPVSAGDALPNSTGTAAPNGSADADMSTADLSSFVLCAAAGGTGADAVSDAADSVLPIPIPVSSSGCPAGGDLLRSGGDAADVLSVLKATASFSTEKNQRRLMKRLIAIVLETAGATRGILVLKNQRGQWRVQLGASIEDELTESPPAHTFADAADAEPIADELERASSASQQAQAGETGTDIPVPSNANSDIEPGYIFSSDAIHATSSSANLASCEQAQRKLEGALPQSVFRYVVSSRETVLLSDPAVPSHLSAFSGDPYFTDSTARTASPPRALLCMPVLQAGSVYGVLYLENDFSSDAFTSSHIQLLQLLCSQAVLSLDNARLLAQLSQHNAHLEELITQRTQQLSAAMQQAERATKIKSEFLAVRQERSMRRCRRTSHRMLRCSFFSLRACSPSQNMSHEIRTVSARSCLRLYVVLLWSAERLTRCLLCVCCFPFSP